jgi:hypothetical protein
MTGSAVVHGTIISEPSLTIGVPASLRPSSFANASHRQADHRHAVVDDDHIGRLAAQRFHPFRKHITGARPAALKDQPADREFRLSSSADSRPSTAQATITRESFDVHLRCFRYYGTPEDDAGLTAALVARLPGRDHSLRRIVDDACEAEGLFPTCWPRSNRCPASSARWRRARQHDFAAERRRRRGCRKTPAGLGDRQSSRGAPRGRRHQRHPSWHNSGHCGDTRSSRSPAPDRRGRLLACALDRS